MENKFDTTESTEEVLNSDTNTVNDDKINNDTDAVTAAPEESTETVTDENPTKVDEDLPESSIGDTIVVPKHIIDEETVEQLVENRAPKKEVSPKEKKKKKKNHYGLKSLIVIIAFVLVFFISFTLARVLFKYESQSVATETQKATDISAKTDNDKTDGEKTFQPETNDSGDSNEAQKAEPIDENKADEIVVKKPSTSVSNDKKTTTTNKTDNKTTVSKPKTDNKNTTTTKPKDENKNTSTTKPVKEDNKTTSTTKPAKENTSTTVEDDDSSMGFVLE